MSEQQQDPSFPVNPETTFHTNILRQQRGGQRRSGLLILAGSIIVLISAAILFGASVFSYHAIPWDIIFLLGMMILAGIAGGIAGIMDLNSGAKPVTGQEVQQIRQQARAELLRRAQGYLPRQYRRSAIIIELVLACLWALMAILSVISAVIGSPLGRVDILLAILFDFGFLTFLGDALITRPREAKRLAARNVQELSNRLKLGEVTDGRTADDE